MKKIRLEYDCDYCKRPIVNGELYMALPTKLVVQKMCEHICPPGYNDATVDDDFVKFRPPVAHYHAKCCSDVIAALCKKEPEKSARMKKMESYLALYDSVTGEMPVLAIKG